MLIRLTGVGLLLAAIVALGGTWYYRTERDSLRHAIWRELESIADLKVRQLAEWRAERTNDARFLTRTPAIARDIATCVEQPDSAEARAAVAGWLEPMKGGDRYESILVVDRALNVRLAIPASAEPPRTPLRNRLQDTFASGALTLTDLHQPSAADPMHMEVLAPVLPAERVSGAASPIAVIVLRLDPRTFLFPLLQSWPNRSESAETLLLRRKGDEIVYLNALRHPRAAPGAVRRPAAETLWLADAAAGNAVREGVDYRGVPVLAAVKAVPDTPWILVAKVDRDEASAPIRRAAWTVMASVALSLAALAGAVAYFWRLRNEQVLRRALEAERSARALAERLALLTRHAHDIILLADDQLRIVEANDSALAAYGYALDELRQLRMTDLLAPEARDAGKPHFGDLRRAGGGAFETLHRRRDDTTFVAEVGGRSVELDGETHLLCIIRDITARRQADTARRESEERYRNMFENNHAVMLIVDPADAAIVDVNPAAARFYGWRREELQRMNVCELNLLSADEVMREMALARAQQRNHFEFRHRLAGGPVRDVEVFSGPVRYGARQLLLSIIHDITDRKAAEAALRESEERLRLFIQHAPASLAMFDREMRYVDMSQRWRVDYGLGARELRGISHYEVFPEIGDSLKAIHRRALAGEVVRVEEDRFPRADGSVQWRRWEARPWHNAAGEVGGIVIFSEDVTARKNAESAFAAQMDELRRWQAAMLGRESRVLELKAEVNRLLVAAGQPPRYATAEKAGDPP